MSKSHTPSQQKTVQQVKGKDGQITEVLSTRNAFSNDNQDQIWSIVKVRNGFIKSITYNIWEKLITTKKAKSAR